MSDSDDQHHRHRYLGLDEDEIKRAEEVAEEVGAENPDPITRREAIELELEDEGISEAGEAIGEHND